MSIINQFQGIPELSKFVCEHFGSSFMQLVLVAGGFIISCLIFWLGYNILKFNEFQIKINQQGEKFVELRDRIESSREEDRDIITKLYKKLMNNDQKKRRSASDLLKLIKNVETFTGK